MNLETCNGAGTWFRASQLWDIATAFNIQMSHQMGSRCGSMIGLHQCGGSSPDF
ncbi:hypothetical protein [Paraburkholderia azotifigens]|uniref:Uncharacterized protein n=1 Tax=Paraburkholderia azotifigens TaxID=2057004 RepID=A0ABU9QYC1_9BURK|nr:hypothetical protein [Paraburkholderia azotifigens]